jgi:hypothetical protein
MQKRTRGIAETERRDPLGKREREREVSPVAPESVKSLKISFFTVTSKGFFFFFFLAFFLENLASFSKNLAKLVEFYYPRTTLIFQKICQFLLVQKMTKIHLNKIIGT